MQMRYIFHKMNEGREATYPVVISERVTCLLLSKSAVSVKKQPSVSYYKSLADVNVI